MSGKPSSSMELRPKTSWKKSKVWPRPSYASSTAGSTGRRSSFGADDLAGQRFHVFGRVDRPLLDRLETKDPPAPGRRRHLTAQAGAQAPGKSRPRPVFCGGRRALGGRSVLRDFAEQIWRQDAEDRMTMVRMTMLTHGSILRPSSPVGLSPHRPLRCPDCLILRNRSQGHVWGPSANQVQVEHFLSADCCGSGMAQSSNRLANVEIKCSEKLISYTWSVFLFS